MKIYIRNDLNMRKGKIAAQSAHALTGVLLGAMKKSESEFILEGDNLSLYKEWKEKGYPIEVCIVNSEEELLEKESNCTVLIKDQGRTEFGKPTYTTCGEFEGVEIKKLIDLETIQLKPAKQTLIANRDLKLTKWDLAPHAALASWLVLEDSMEKEENKWILKLNNEALSSWLLGAFAKITLKIEEENIELILNNLKEHSIDHYKIEKEKGLIVLATSPQFSENIDPVTSHLKLY
mgnify:CR=1 FL=1|jgi:PTH2 family peptidyl-tRNA hydrolase